MANWTTDELRAAFERIENKTDWRKPIHTVVERKDLALFSAACEFFTSTPLRFVRNVADLDRPALDLVEVAAKGYRAGPAGP